MTENLTSSTTLLSSIYTRT